MSDEAARTLRGGRYALVRPLGQGSQGQTWEAIDHVEQRTVAIKQFNVRGARAWKDVELAEREARVLKKLSHPLLPAYVEHFEEDEALYLVMEKVEGTPLSILQKEGGLAEADVRRLLADADRALSYLHCWSPPIIHRDLKPANVIRRPDGSFAFVDFGAVRDRLQPEGGSTVVGTFGFMAPEQFQGRAGPASDVYSIAATALAMLTTEEPERLAHRGLGIDVEKVLEGRASPGLIAALSRMLQIDPDARPTAIGPVLASLSGGARDVELPGVVQARRPGSAAYRIGLAVGLTALGFAMFMGVHARRSPAPMSVDVAPTPPASPSSPAPPTAPRAPEPMVPLPGGTFVTRDLQRTVTVAPFAIDANEVTAADMRVCVEAGRCTWGGREGNYEWPGNAQFPMNYVTWKEAAGYCAAQGKELPTEDEWEWAARGGAEGRKYPWGEAPLTDQVCQAGCGGCPVGTYPRGDARGGIHDLSDEEWTSTPDGAGAHIVRGWRWRFEKPTRDVDRSAVGTDQRYCGLGFRCMRPATPRPKPRPPPAPATLTWSGRVASSSGAAPGGGTPCVVATTVDPTTLRGDDVLPRAFTLTCGGAVLYDSSIALVGMSSYSFRLEEHETTASGAFRYGLVSDDLGARSGGKAQISVNSPMGVAEAFRDTAPSFRVRVALDKLSAPWLGPPLSPK